jgi:hypothetical protein
LRKIDLKNDCLKTKKKPKKQLSSPWQTQYLYFSLAQSSHSGRRSLCAPASQSDDSKLMSRANREKSAFYPVGAPISLHKTNSSRFRAHAQAAQPLATWLPALVNLN